MALRFFACSSRDRLERPPYTLALPSLRLRMTFLVEPVRDKGRGISSTDISSTGIASTDGSSTYRQARSQSANMIFCTYRVCIVHIQPRKRVLDRAHFTAPTRQHELDHTNHTNHTDIFPERSTVDHQVETDDLSVMPRVTKHRLGVGARRSPFIMIEVRHDNTQTSHEHHTSSFLILFFPAEALNLL